MSNMNKLAESLHSVFPNNTVRTLGGVYNHVVLEMSDFTLGDYEFKKMLNIANQHFYSFYMTPRYENGRNARHTITFYT